jgi:DNA-binding MarR family transcriptional regulator
MDDLVASLERAAHALAVALAPLGITQAEAHVLARLACGPARIRDLHRAFGHKRSTLTAVLDRLERRGYVRRAPDPDDRRSVIASLTADGKPVARRVRSTVAQLERRIATACSSEDLAGFGRVVSYMTSMASPNE